MARGGALCLVSVAVMAGCAPLPKGTGNSAQQLFTTALEQLDDRYIEPIEPAALMMSGLTHLSAVDDRLEVYRTPGSVVLAIEDEIVATLVRFCRRSVGAPDRAALRPVPRSLTPG